MGCLFVLFAGVFPRLARFIVGVARPSRVDAAFGSWIWPRLGIIFLPFAALVYLVVWGTRGLIDLGWFWVILASLGAIAHTGKRVGPSGVRRPATRPGHRCSAGST